MKLTKIDCIMTIINNGGCKPLTCNKCFFDNDDTMGCDLHMGQMFYETHDIKWNRLVVDRAKAELAKDNLKEILQ
jgi:hypothetical protein